MAVTFKSKGISDQEKTPEVKLPVATTVVKTASVTVVKKVTKTKKIEEAVSQEDLELLSKQLSDLTPNLNAAKETVKAFDDLKKKFVSVFMALNTDTNPNDELAYTDENLSVTLSPISYSRSISDLKALHQLIGDDFYSYISVSFANLDKHFNPQEMATFGIEYKQGSRTIKSLVKK